MNKEKAMIVMAVGGTGGHVFPAQAIARDVLRDREGVRIIFMGKDLSKSRYFHGKEFVAVDVASGGIFGKGMLQCAHGIIRLIQGTAQSIRYLRREKPNLVVGFGSFYAFPVLLGAFFCRIPIALFESNIIPGKVIRLFSSVAKVTGVHFAHTKKHLKGVVQETMIPIWDRDYIAKFTREEAAKYFGLRSDCTTILVFGGSQGALSINKMLIEAIETYEKRPFFQIIHLTGDSASCQESLLAYSKLGIAAQVKMFEDRMPLAFRMADLVICRAGAATMAELLFFQVPAILIPYPHATENHQMRNAEVFVNEVQGGVMIQEKELTSSILAKTIDLFLKNQGALLKKKKEAIAFFQQRKERNSFSSIIQTLLGNR